MFTWIEFGFVQLREQSSAWNMDKTGSACNAGSVSCVYHDISVECLARQESRAHSNQPTDQPAGAGKQASKQANKQTNKHTLFHLAASRSSSALLTVTRMRDSIARFAASCSNGLQPSIKFKQVQSEGSALKGCGKDI